MKNNEYTVRLKDGIRLLNLSGSVTTSDSWMMGTSYSDARTPSFVHPQALLHTAITLYLQAQNVLAVNYSQWLADDQALYQAERMHKQATAWFNTLAVDTCGLWPDSAWHLAARDLKCKLASVLDVPQSTVGVRYIRATPSYARTISLRDYAWDCIHAIVEHAFAHCAYEPQLLREAWSGAVLKDRTIWHDEGGE